MISSGSKSFNRYIKMLLWWKFKLLLVCLEVFPNKKAYITHFWNLKTTRPLKYINIYNWRNSEKLVCVNLLGTQLVVFLYCKKNQECEQKTYTCICTRSTRTCTCLERGQTHTQWDHVFNYFESVVKMMSLSNREYFIMPLSITLFYSITF